MSHDLELLPCPFCGGEEIGISSASSNVIKYMCLTCEGSGGYAVGDTESKGVWDEAHSLWNTRADLHQQALDRIEELEAEVIDIFQQYVDANEARIDLEATLKKLEYWFDADQEVLDAMTTDERADHMRQLKRIREALNNGGE